MTRRCLGTVSRPKVEIVGRVLEPSFVADFPGQCIAVSGSQSTNLKREPSIRVTGLRIHPRNSTFPNFRSPPWTTC